MEEFVIREKLDSIRNEMTHLWGSVFIVGGGAITFLCVDPNLIKIIIGIFGIMILPALMNAYFIRRNELQTIIKNINKVV